MIFHCWVDCVSGQRIVLGSVNISAGDSVNDRNGCSSPSQISVQSSHLETQTTTTTTTTAAAAAVVPKPDLNALAISPSSSFSRIFSAVSNRAAASTPRDLPTMSSIANNATNVAMAMQNSPFRRQKSAYQPSTDPQHVLSSVVINSYASSRKNQTSSAQRKRSAKVFVSSHESGSNSRAVALRLTSPNKTVHDNDGESNVVRSLSIIGIENL